MTEGLDRTDLAILRNLQRDGRIGNAALARLLGIPPATCHRRTESLFARGYITGVRAVLAPVPLRRGALVMVGVVLDRSTPESFNAFETAVARIAAVLDCHLVAGDFDYFLKIRVRDMSDFNRLHATQLIGLPGVRQMRSFFVIREVVDNAPLDI